MSIARIPLHFFANLVEINLYELVTMVILILFCYNTLLFHAIVGCFDVVIFAQSFRMLYPVLLGNVSLLNSSGFTQISM